MTTPTTILRDSARFVPVLVVLGAVVGGVPGALAVLATSVVTLLNLVLLAWMSADPSRFLALVVPKLFASLAAFAGLVTFFDPLVVGVTLASVLTAVAIAGMVRAAADDRLEALQAGGLEALQET